MFELLKSSSFDRWLRAFRDPRSLARVLVRLDRLALGHFGDAKNLGAGVSELRVDVGPGYRIYYTRRGKQVVLLLCGGDKSTQRSDIVEAKRLAATWQEG